jgi:hypothetical protein
LNQSALFILAAKRQRPNLAKNRNEVKSMSEEFTAANTGAVNVAASEGPATPETQFTTESQVTTATAPTMPPVVEDVTQTQAFAHRLKEESSKASTKALDDFISTQGYEYNGKPIKTYAEYQAAQTEVEEANRKAQFQQQNGFDPDAVKPLFEQWKQNDPDFQELSQIRQEKTLSSAISQLNTELQDAGIDLQIKDTSPAELAKLPNVDKITEYVSKGHSLADAFFLANKKDIISKQTTSVQQETIKRIAANGASSPGSLAAGSDQSGADVWSMSDKDFKAMQERALRGELRK